MFSWWRQTMMIAAAHSRRRVRRRIAEEPRAERQAQAGQMEASDT